MFNLKKYIIIFIVSMIPLIELRGAVPLALSERFGGSLPVFPSYIVCIIANMIPVPFIFWFARKVLEWGKDKKIIGGFFTFCLEKGEKGGKKLQATAGRGLYFALFLFVGIPVPGTGAWTGTLAASILDMDWKKSAVAVMAGVILAGIIMGVGFEGIKTIIGLF
ncbi:MAG: small multi-drug export protein [Lachnospiraceae bacterium]|nr:small multi-drug export protein [Lachnospiraceae bacterium]